MSPKARLGLELSEKREALNTLLEIPPDALTAEQKEQRESLTKRLQEIEPELRSAIVLEETNTTSIQGTPENMEYRALVNRSSLGGIYHSVLEHKSTSGAEKELQEHLGLATNQIPLDLLAMPEQRSEHRAVTPAPADVGQNQASVLPGVFPMAAAAFMGVDQPRVAVGDAIFPVLTMNATAHTPAENAAAAETTGAFSAEVLSPKRIQASFFYSREDRARFSGMDASLRNNLGMALADGLDKQVIAGADGFFGANGLTNPTNPSDEADFSAYRSVIYDASVIEGKYASSASAIRVLFGAATYAHAASIYRGNNADDSALDSLMRVAGGVRVSAHVPAVVSTVQGLVLAKGALRHAVSPIWEGIQLVPDEVTLADKGQIKVTAIMLHSIKILRSDGFARKELKVSA